MEKWEYMYAQLHNATGPIKCLSEGNKTQTIIRDFWNDGEDKIVFWKRVK
jgi:ribonuclease G